MGIYRIPFPFGVWEIERTSYGVKTLFTPLEEPPVFSLLEGKVIKRDPTLEGFFVDVPSFGEFFLPNKQPQKVKVGEKILLQVSRESLEGKPPTVSTKIIIPFCGCEIVLNNKSRVFFLTEKKHFEELKNWVSRWKVSLNVYNPSLCLKNLPFAEKFIRLLVRKNLKLPFLWKGIYTLLLNSCGGNIFAPSEDLCSELEPLKELFPLNINCAVKGLKKILKEVKISEIASRVFSEKFSFNGGFLLIGTTGGITAIDINGYTSKSELNKNALKAVAEYLNIAQIGGSIIVDLAGLKRNSNLKEDLRKLLTPLGCKVLGYTNGGLLEIICPKRTPPVKERLGLYNPVCGNVVKNNLLLVYEILEKLPDIYTEEIILKINPLRREIEEELRKFTLTNLKIRFDWNIPLNNFSLEF